MEILSDVDIESLQKTLNTFSSEFSFNKFDNEEMQKALNTIKLQRQQIAQRDAEVAEAIAIVKAMSPKHAITCPANIGPKTCHCDSEAVNEWIVGQLGDLPAKAEAHDAKVWNEAVEACINIINPTLKEWVDPYNREPIYVLDGVCADIELDLTKKFEKVTKGNGDYICDLQS